MNERFKQLDDERAKWVAVQPLKPEDQDRLWRKFRLEWNYNSNHIEGNTLTYGETELLLIQGQTSGNHAIRDYEEMKAHDVAVTHVYELAKNPSVIREADIRDLNKIILKEPFWKEARTQDGQTTRIQVIPGEYKHLPNNVQTSTGEFVAFATPTDTPAKVRALTEWLRLALENSGEHPIDLASKLHHDFTLIHPFDDGNGRVARLLMNYVLMRAGFPPLIIKSPDKSNYISALRQADSGNFDAFTNYLARQLQWSLDIALRASRGETIEEPSDIEKEIALFVRDLNNKRGDVKKRSPAILQELYQTSWEPLLGKLEEKMSKLSPLFADTKISVQPAFSQNWREAFPRAFTLSGQVNAIGVYYQFYAFKAVTPDVLNINTSLEFHFEDFRYRLRSNGKELAVKLYTDLILSDEIESITSTILRHVFEEAKSKVKK